MPVLQMFSSVCNVRWDDKQDEPYIPLEGQGIGIDEFRLTPWREGDDDRAVELFNVPDVGQYAHRRPYPYRKQDMDFIWHTLHPACQRTAAALKPMLSSSTKERAPALPSACDSQTEATGQDTPSSASAPAPLGHGLAASQFPVPVIRHHSSGRLVGDMNLFEDIPGGVSAAHGQWLVAYNLHPEYRGKGIARAAMRAVLGWASWVGVGRVIAEAAESNAPSRALLEKSGFEQVEGDSTGRRVGMVRYELDLSGEDD